MTSDAQSVARIQFDARNETDETTLLAIHGDFDEAREAPEELDVRPAVVMTIFTGVIFAYYRGPLSLTAFIVSGSYLVGRIIKRVTDGYDFMRTLEEWGVKLVRKVPYIQILATLLSFVASLILVQLAYALATGTGLLSALTIDTESYAVAGDQNALQRGLQQGQFLELTT